MMMKALNSNDENDPMPFVSLGLATTLILNRLRLATQLIEATEEDHEERKRDARSTGADEEGKPDQERRVG